MKHLSRLKYFEYFPFVFYILICHSLRRSNGHLRFNHLCFLTLGFIVFTLFNFYKSSPRGSSIGELKEFFNFERVFNFTWPLLAIFLATDHGILYTQNNWALSVFKVLSSLHVFLALLNLIQYLYKGYRPELKYIGLAILGLQTLLVLPISPKPIVDVWVYANMASEYLLAGENFYKFIYPDLYAGKYDLTYGYIYWPLPTYLFTLAKSIGLDVRWSMSFIHIASFYFSSTLVTGPKNKLILSLLWGLFSVNFFILEQSWLEGFIPAFIFIFFYLLKKESLVKAAIFLGLICSFKQYFLFFYLLSLFYIYAKFDLIKMIKTLVISSLVIVFLLAPYLILDFNMFVEKTILNVLAMKPRLDSLSWSSYFLKIHGAKISSTLTLISSFLIMIGHMFYLKKKPTLLFLMGSMISVYLFVFLFGKQAFCNYYYLIGAFMIVYLGELLNVQKLKI